MKKGVCKHFNGTIGGQRATCEAGVNYRELVGGPDYGWVSRLPCNTTFKVQTERVTCDQREEPTPEEIAKDKAWVQVAIDRMQKVEPLVEQIKQEFHGRDVAGSSPCPICGKVIYWRHAAYNGHVHMHCETEDCISFME